MHSNAILYAFNFVFVCIQIFSLMTSYFHIDSIARCSCPPIQGWFVVRKSSPICSEKIICSGTKLYFQYRK